MEEEITGGYEFIGSFEVDPPKPKVLKYNFGPKDIIYKDGKSGRFISKKRAAELGLEDSLNP